jgi:hypothetical protein
MSETPWWAAAGGAALLGTGAFLAIRPVGKGRRILAASKAYGIKGKRKTGVVANIVKQDGQYSVEWDFPYGLRSAEGRIFEVPLNLYPENASGFTSLDHAMAYADGEMERLPWFSSRHG